MRKVIGIVVVTLLMVATIVLPVAVGVNGCNNHKTVPSSMVNQPVITSVYTSSVPTIDGIISGGKWTNKISITFNGFNTPSNTKTGDLYNMNDNDNLYVAVGVPDSDQDADYLMLDFDQDNDHVVSMGDEDAAGFNVHNVYNWFQAGMLIVIGVQPQ